jgi:2-iminobutanoate/2-iminopropanoate deaminase
MLQQSRGIIKKENAMQLKVYTKHAPDAIGPYSQAVVCGGMVYTSGLIPLSPATGAVVEGDITVQAAQALDNLKAVLEAAGSGPDHVVKTTCFLADMADFQAFNAVYSTYFPNKPARSCVAVRQLPKSALVEVEAIAEIPVKG